MLLLVAKYDINKFSVIKKKAVKRNSRSYGFYREPAVGVSLHYSYF